MSRLSFLTVIGLSLLAAAPALASDYDRPDKLVTLPDGRKLNLYCSGSGRPTVLLEAGYQAWSFAWVTTQMAIEKKYRVCSYDRAGLGFSDPGPSPRDGNAIASDLDEVITAAKLKPPFVLVGHSAGALSMRLLADKRPADVAGMVFVDPSIEGQFDAIKDSVRIVAKGYYDCEAPARAGKLYSAEYPKCANPSFAWMPAGMKAQIGNAGKTPEYWHTQGSEYESIAFTTTEQVRRGRQSYGDLPIVVLTAGSNPRWQAAHAELAGRSTRGVQHLFPTSGHLLQNEHPEAVAAAVDEVVAAGVEPHRHPR